MFLSLGTGGGGGGGGEGGETPILNGCVGMAHIAFYPQEVSILSAKFTPKITEYF